ncbi:dTDP-4-keto-6-deoxy-D-glucose epimerase [Mycolicibacterium sp. 018/SC-01/001]|uniref:dTDP-4-dehydrorhamnose 3,5-epimerase family protein n=1 Tax=Mycolicibacterium sp. 018/SC-01/001 TaxID=2592069 RepID=UPI00118084EF|nr:dTDP-4-dehydrorhamnose 3,5-epimerase family protein [Mycolicibacterium sp. 018/SC-01/001]TRW82860.1 dTDP-4-keto-6-deoxy-D-glucose epimerase [Mycolicibacterium sp. 018/SC-01/001]
MRIEPGRLAGVVTFVPQPHHDERGWFTRTFDAEVFDQWCATRGVDSTAARFIQDSQSRSARGVIRGMHGRRAPGEAKLVRCARGAVHDVLVDARPDSPTFGEHEAFLLDDTTCAHLFVPPGMLHGFQALTEWADVCYRIDRAHDPADDLAVSWQDPTLGIEWPMPPSTMSARDAGAGSWPELLTRIR